MVIELTSLEFGAFSVLEAAVYNPFSW